MVVKTQVLDSEIGLNLKTCFEPRASCSKSFFSFLFPSRLCSTGVPWRPEADPHGGDEDAGHATRRRLFHSEGVSTHNGDSHSGEPPAWSPNAQAQTQRHEHPDALRLLRGRPTTVRAA